MNENALSGNFQFPFAINEVRRAFRWLINPLSMNETWGSSLFCGKPALPYLLMFITSLVISSLFLTLPTLQCVMWPLQALCSAGSGK